MFYRIEYLYTKNSHNFTCTVARDVFIIRCSSPFEWVVFFGYILWVQCILLLSSA
jgi:hypothetical protein